MIYITSCFGLLPIHSSSSEGASARLGGGGGRRRQAGLSRPNPSTRGDRRFAAPMPRSRRLSELSILLTRIPPELGVRGVAGIGRQDWARLLSCTQLQRPLTTPSRFVRGLHLLDFFFLPPSLHAFHTTNSAKGDVTMRLLRLLASASEYNRHSTAGPSPIGRAADLTGPMAAHWSGFHLNKLLMSAAINLLDVPGWVGADCCGQLFGFGFGGPRYTRLGARERSERPRGVRAGPPSRSPVSHSSL